MCVARIALRGALAAAVTVGASAVMLATAVAIAVALPAIAFHAVALVALAALTMLTGVAMIAIAVLRALDAPLESLEAVENLFEFALEASASPAILGGGNRGEGHEEDGNQLHHGVTVNPENGSGFRPLGGLPIIGAVKRIDHVGVAVGDLEEARKLWDLVLGQEPDCEVVDTQKVETAMYPCGIELVAPVSDDSPISKFLAKRGSGIHHVTVEVDDIEGHLARLKESGVRLINETPTPGHGGCRMAFLHPASTGGVLVELKEQA